MTGFGEKFNNINQKAKKDTELSIKKISQQGFLFHSKGNFKDAIRCYQYCINKKIDDHRIYSNYGLILKNLGRLKEAEKLLRKAIEINPSSADAHTNLGTLLKNLCKFSEAEISHRKAIQIDPNSALAHTNLGNVLRELNKFEEAEKAYLKAIQIDPNSTLAYANLGDMLKNMGRLKEAKSMLLKSIEINPDFVKTYYSLSKLSIEKQDFNWHKYLLAEKILNKKNTKEKVEIYFARSNILHKEKKYKESAMCLEIANKLKLTIYPSDVNKLINKANLLLQQSRTQKIIKNQKNYPESIFIVGMPRSGSTLLESIISLNKEVKDLGEINILEKAYQESLKTNQKLNLTDLYIQKIHEFQKEFKITSNKFLYNYQYVGIIASQISNSKIIHCFRNPLDNILSIYRSNFSTGNTYSSSMVDTAKVYLNQKEVMNIYKKQFSSKIYELDYDLLVTDPKKTIKSLIKWLGWDWNKDYLYPHINQRPIFTSSDVQVRSPINSKSIGGWKNYEEILQPVFKIL